MNSISMASLPEYKCFKEFWALKIKSIVIDGEGENRETDGSATITPEEAFIPFMVSAEYMQKHKPKVGGYWVKYKDGYESYSPADAFEDGYESVDPLKYEKPKEKRHVEKALLKFHSQLDEINTPFPFIAIENMEDVKGVAPVVKFTIQSDPIKEVGVNGCQAEHMLLYVRCLFESLNEVFPCVENQETIESLDKAYYWQQKRTQDRLKRNVEGENKA